MVFLFLIQFWMIVSVFSESLCRPIVILSDGHSRCDRLVGGFVDEDQAAGVAVEGIGIDEEGLGGADVDLAYFVHGEAGAALDLFEGVDVQHIIYGIDHAFHVPGIMF